eukprot:1161878-Pelagomonas_calceolata.AAC.10
MGHLWDGEAVVKGKAVVSPTPRSDPAHHVGQMICFKARTGGGRRGRGASRTGVGSERSGSRSLCACLGQLVLHARQPTAQLLCHRPAFGSTAARLAG